MEENKLVYSTDSEEHKINFEEREEEFDDLGMYQDGSGAWYIKEELMWDGVFDDY